jgi:hypothetical protein
MQLQLKQEKWSGSGYEIHSTSSDSSPILGLLGSKFKNLSTLMWLRLQQGKDAAPAFLLRILQIMTIPCSWNNP